MVQLSINQDRSTVRSAISLKVFVYKRKKDDYNNANMFRAALMVFNVFASHSGSSTAVWARRGTADQELKTLKIYRRPLCIMHLQPVQNTSLCAYNLFTVDDVWTLFISRLRSVLCTKRHYFRFHGYARPLVYRV